MSDIQKAREVLAVWRNDYPFLSSDEVVDTLRAGEAEKGHRDGWYSEDRLIVGTAGNPELLDAIDECLEVGADYADLFEGVLPPTGAPGRVLAHANRIAAAIIAADERMRS